MDKSQNPTKLLLGVTLRRATLMFGITTAYMLLGPVPSHAEEGDSTPWPNGIQTIAPARLPLPGNTEFYNYTQFYRAWDLNDSKGHASAPGFQLDVIAEAGRLIHTWNTSFYGFHISSGVVIAATNTNLHVAGRSGYATGIQNVYLTPVYLTYQTGTLHLLWGGSLFIPGGSYNASKLANSADNYYSYNNETAFTYFATPRLEISAENELTLNGNNPATHYHSGAVDNTDFGVNYSFLRALPELKLGLNGFYTHQFQDDTISGMRVGDGNRLEELTVGPQVIFYFAPGKAVALKWQHEIIAHNAPQGDRIWFEFALPL